MNGSRIWLAPAHDARHPRTARSLENQRYMPANFCLSARRYLRRNWDDVVPRGTVFTVSGTDPVMAVSGLLRNSFRFIPNFGEWELPDDAKLRLGRAIKFEPVRTGFVLVDRFGPFFLPVKYRCSFFRGRLNRQVGINRTFIPILGLPEMGLGSSSAHTKNSSIENWLRYSRCKICHQLRFPGTNRRLRSQNRPNGSG